MSVVKYATAVDFYSRIIGSSPIPPWDHLEYHYYPNVYVVDLRDYGFGSKSIRHYKEEDSRHLICLMGENESVLDSAINEGLNPFGGVYKSYEEALEIAKTFVKYGEINEGDRKIYIKEPYLNENNILTLEISNI